MAPAAQPEPGYKKDEKVLCFHHELLYDAKILDVKPVEEEENKGGFEYKVHYKGWKNTWDDWVPEDRLRKLNQQNRELAMSLRNEVLAAQRAQRAAVQPVKKKQEKGSTRGSEERQTSVAAPGPRGQKRVRDQDLEKEETFQSRRAVRIPVPDRLKSLMVDDWENVTKNLQLVQLPAAKPAGVIIDEYYEYTISHRRLSSAERDILEEVVAGLKEYFNKALGRILLYRFEREQLFDINNQIEDPTSDLAGKSMADIYGGEHLLRLFASMPELIAQTNMDAQSVSRLREELVNMLAWLSKEPRVSTFFCSVYESPGQEYIDKAKSTS